MRSESLQQSRKAEDTHGQSLCADSKTKQTDQSKAKAATGLLGDWQLKSGKAAVSKKLIAANAMQQRIAAEAVSRMPRARRRRINASNNDRATQARNR